MRNIYFTIYVFGFLAIDILSKYIVENSLTTKIEIFSEILTLEKIYNTGIAFSIPLPPFFLKILTVILIFGIIGYYFYERKSHTSRWYDIGFALIIGGALGNAIERIFQGYVTDFISVQHFSIFNIADSCICVGAAILMYYYWKKPPTI